MSNGETRAGPGSGDPDTPYESIPGVEEEHPRGTMFLMMLYLIMTIAMWGFVYMTMIGRG